MMVRLHKNATTTPATRRYIQNQSADVFLHAAMALLGKPLQCLVGIVG